MISHMGVRALVAPSISNDKWQISKGPENHLPFAFCHSFPAEQRVVTGPATVSSETKHKPQALFDLLEEPVGEMTCALDQEALVDG